MDTNNGFPLKADSMGQATCTMIMVVVMVVIMIMIIMMMTTTMMMMIVWSTLCRVSPSDTEATCDAFDEQPLIGVNLYTYRGVAFNEWN